MNAFLYKELMDMHPIESLCIGLDGRIVQISGSATDLLGCDKALVGQNFYDLFSEPRAKIATQISQCAASSVLSLTLPTCFP